MRKLDETMKIISTAIMVALMLLSSMLVLVTVTFVSVPVAATGSGPFTESAPHAETLIPFEGEFGYGNTAWNALALDGVLNYGHSSWTYPRTGGIGYDLAIPLDATIYDVQVIAKGETWSGSSPTWTLNFCYPTSVWKTPSSPIAVQGGENYVGYWYSYNVTDQLSWNASICNGNDLGAMVTVNGYDHSGQWYLTSLDYIGFNITWGYPGLGLISTNVFAPTARHTATQSYGYIWDLADIKRLDFGYCGLGQGAISTYDYTSPYYSHYWPPWNNRASFPPDNATIVSVHALVIMLIPTGRTANMAILVTSNASYTQLLYSGQFTHSNGLFHAYEYNMTTALDSFNHPVNWTAAVLKGGNPEVGYGVEITLRSPESGGAPVYVDYIGLNYTWSVPAGSPPPSGGGGTNWGLVPMPSVLGIIGVIGFVGMVGIPAISIYFYRQEGGSKLGAGVVALIGFVVCFGLFMSAINS